AFANFGFAESHSLAFAQLVYVSSWLKLHYPAAFLAALLRAQPMGFYSAATLTADARRHGVQVRRPDLHASGVHPGLERVDTATETEHRYDADFAVRLGLAAVRGIGEQTALRIVAERDKSGPFRDLNDLVRRTDATAAQLEALATAGAFECLGLSRREALWLAGSAAEDRAQFLPGTTVAVQPPLFPDQSSFEQLTADLWATGVSTDDHPIAHFRPMLQSR